MSSLADAVGQPRENFALSDVFGADYLEPLTLAVSYLRFDQPDDLASNLRRGFPYTHRAPMLKVRSGTAARAIGRVVQGREGLNRLSYDCHPPMWSASLYPAAVQNTFGKGKSVYYPGLPGTIFSRWGHDIGKKMIASACQTVASYPSPLTIEAPLCVEATLYSRPSGELVAHLVNFQPGLARTWDIVRERFVI